MFDYVAFATLALSMMQHRVAQGNTAAMDYYLRFLSRPVFR
jgi:hypothetical protein